MSKNKIEKGITGKLHWTTFWSEKILLAIIGGLTVLAAGLDIFEMVIKLKVELGDLF